MAVKACDMSNDKERSQAPLTATEQAEVDQRVSQILIAYPAEPDWLLVDDAVLIELVFCADCEPYFADVALAELSRRGNSAVGDLCIFLLKEQGAHSGLKAQAISLLPDTHLALGMDELLVLICWCDAEMLESVVSAAHEKLQNDLPSQVCSHPLVGIINLLTSRREAIYFAGSLSKDEFMRANKLAAPTRISWSKFMLGLGGWAIACAVLAGLGRLETPAILMCLLGLALVWMGWRLESEQALLWERNPNCRGHVFGVIGEAGIDAHGEDFWRFTAWPKLSHWATSGDELLVVVSPIEARAFPASFFASSADYERARARCADNLKSLSESLSTRT